MFALKTLYSKMVKNVDFNIFYEMLVLDTNIYWTSWYLQLLPCMLPLYICLNLWLAVAVAALTNLPVTSVHISQLGGPSIWFLHTYLLLSRYTQWQHMWWDLPGVRCLDLVSYSPVFLINCENHQQKFGRKLYKLEKIQHF